MKGTIYLIHFEQPVGEPDENREAKGRPPRKGQVFGASHYLGWAKDYEKRLKEHANGNGSKLCTAARRAGIGFSIVRTWQGDRDRERQIKNTHSLKSYCPVCKAEINRKRREKYKLKKLGIAGAPLFKNISFADLYNTALALFLKK